MHLPASPAALRSNTLGPLARRLFWAFAVLGIAGLAAGAALGKTQNDDFRYTLHSYLLSYTFFLSISLGGLFFVALQHATRAGWSVTVRRLAEFMAANMSVLILLFLPILAAVLLGKGNLYDWADAKTAASDPALRHKAAYLNPTFFAVRSAVYFLIWAFLGGFFLRRSLAQDRSGLARPTLQMEAASPIALVLFALTTTFASFDWLMSLDARWVSTIYGLYYYSGAVVAFLGMVILAAIFLQATGRLGDAITTEHYHDLGKFLFGFVIFWGYMAFSQYLLIWYANIPEETTWYLARQAGAWKWLSLVLLAGNLFVPFFGLLSREVKRRKWLLGFWAVWLLVFHWIDLYWLVMPSLGGATLPLGPIDACLAVGIGGLYLAGLVRQAGENSLVPLADPRLDEALAFENA